MAWLLRPQLLAAMESVIDKLADDVSALSDSERAARLRRLEAELLEAQRAEVAAIDRERGDHAYRVGTDPRAILNVSVEEQDA